MAVFIDKQGRIFGRLNLIDALVLFVLIATIPLWVAVIKIYNTEVEFTPPPPTSPPKPKITITKKRYGELLRKEDILDVILTEYKRIRKRFE